MAPICGGFNPCTICSSNPKYFERNDKIALSIWSVAFGVIYAYMGYFLHRQCPADPNLALWAVVGGIGIGVANPIFLFTWSRDLLNLEGEGRCVKILKLILLATTLVLGAIWWIIGSVMICSMRGRVNYDRNPPTDYCDPVLYTITLETVLVIFICLVLGLVWVLGLYLCEPTCRSRTHNYILNCC